MIIINSFLLWLHIFCYLWWIDKYSKSFNDSIDLKDLFVVRMSQLQKLNSDVFIKKYSIN
jgi:hypothetical protein